MNIVNPTKHLLIILLLLSVGLGSCRKFLDKPQNSGLSLVSSVRDCQDILDNGNLYNQSPMDGLISSDDYYFADADFDAMPETDRMLHVWDPSAQRLIIANNASTDWYHSYKKLNSINFALESLETIASKNAGIQSGADYQMAKGMGLFLRAYCFHQLVVQYAKAYTAATASQDMGIDIRLSSDINVASSRATVKQTYDRITQDLTDAISLLPGTTLVPTHPSKAAAYAMLARVYLSMEEYNLAAAAANSCLQLKSDLMDFNNIDQTSAAPFRRFNKEVLYYSYMSYLDARYRIHPSIIAGFTDINDLRKPVLFTENTSPNTGTYYFKGSYSGDDYTYFNGLATDEIYLIRAETYARAGNTALAMADLNTLLTTRWKTGTYVNMTASDASDALNKVLAERRKELVMRGLRWSDLKRLNKTPATAQTLSRTVKGITYTLPPNDLRYQLLIPQAAIEYSSMLQNPR